MEAENKKNITLGPIISIGALIVAIAVAGLFFYKSLMSGSIALTDTPTTPVVVETKQPETVLQPEEELAALEQELEEVTVDIDENDLFGLDQLDAELIEFTDLDDLLDFEL